MLVYGKYECFVMQLFYVCALCASCGSSQCCILHDLHFLNAGRGCMRRPYGRGILQIRSRDCLIVTHDVSFCLPHPVAVSAFIICIGLCACTEMLCMCVLYMRFGSKKAHNLWCGVMRSAVLSPSRSRLLLYYAGSGVNRVQVVCLGLM